MAWWLIVVVVIVALVVLTAMRDLTQRKHAILRNFPVIGHFRYWLEAVGPELRQYIVTDNDEERPFSRDQRRRDGRPPRRPTTRANRVRGRRRPSHRREARTGRRAVHQMIPTIPQLRAERAEGGVAEHPLLRHSPS